MLKTHELEMEQRSKQHEGKSMSIALKEVAIKKSHLKGKTLIIKSNSEASNYGSLSCL